MKNPLTKILFIILITSFVNQRLLSQNSFITRWDLSLSAGSGNSEISFGVITSGTVNYTWETVPVGTSGSGSFSGSTATITGLPANAIIDLSISPTNFNALTINNGLDKSRLIDIKQWGTVTWSNFGGSFSGCNNLNITATDVPNMTAVRFMSYMFRGCTILNGPTNIGTWNTSNVIAMRGTFTDAKAFNQPIGTWNTALVVDMAEMFSNASTFNQPIGSWNTAAVTTFSSMFYKATAFNQSLTTWNTAAVLDMGYMFFEATSFNQSIGSWNTAAVRDMRYMFYDADAFNQPIGSWNTASVTTMSNMFQNNNAFNQPIGTWNTTAVTNMFGMFLGTGAFNQPIGAWNTAAVTQMGFMFFSATAFNQNIGSWNIANTTDMANIFTNSGINQLNYNAILIGWDNGGYTNKNLGNAAPLTYCAGQAARDNLINGKGWSISGDALFCNNAEIKLKGNNVLISNGQTSPSLSDHTDFGSHSVFSGSLVRTFTIENLGAAALNLTNPPNYVALSGPHATDFIISLQATSPVAPNNGSTTFQVLFNPSAHGTRKATVNIPNSDGNANPFTFDLQGYGCGSITISSGTDSQIADDIKASTQISNANVKYSVSRFVELLPGFKVENAVFLAQTGGCN